MPPPPCTMLARCEITIVPEGVINIDSGGGGGRVGQTAYFFALVRSSWRRFHNFAECLTSFATDHFQCSRSSRLVMVVLQLSLCDLKSHRPTGDSCIRRLVWTTYPQDAIVDGHERRRGVAFLTRTFDSPPIVLISSFLFDKMYKTCEHYNNYGILLSQGSCSHFVSRSWRREDILERTGR